MKVMQLPLLDLSLESLFSMIGMLSLINFKSHVLYIGSYHFLKLILGCIYSEDTHMNK